jgi:hypothetical protein
MANRKMPQLARLRGLCGVVLALPSLASCAPYGAQPIPYFGGIYAPNYGAPKYPNAINQYPDGSSQGISPFNCGPDCQAQHEKERSDYIDKELHQPPTELDKENAAQVIETYKMMNDFATKKAERLAKYCKDNGLEDVDFQCYVLLHNK